MRFYLSSYKLGNEITQLQELTKDWNKKVAYISNALDFAKNLERRAKNEEEDINLLAAIGFDVEILDLRNYFGKQEELRNKIKEYWVIWVGWGNCFVLRQAMKLSGFDEIIVSLAKEDNSRVYWWYSAGVCILAPTLKGLDIVDNTTKFPYENRSEVIYDWLWVIDFSIVPHYKSDHPESEAVNGIVEYYTANNTPFKTLHDWEVIIIR